MSQTGEISIVKKGMAPRRSFLKKISFKDESGATAVEYSLLVGLVAVFLIAAITTLGSSISETFREAACKIQGKAWTDGNPNATPATTGTCAP